MYRSLRQRAWIRKRVLVDGVSRRRIARQTGLSPNTVRKMLLHPFPETYTREPRRGGTASGGRLEASRAAYTILQTMSRRQAIEFLRVIMGSEVRGDSAAGVRQAISRAVISASAAAVPNRREKRSIEAHELVRELRAGHFDKKRLNVEFAGLPELPQLHERLNTGSEKDRNKAIAVLLVQRGCSNKLAARSIGLSPNTYRSYKRLYSTGGTEALFVRCRRSKPSKSEDESYRNAVFALLHEPPAAYGINRTSWKLDDLVRVLGDKGLSLCRGTLSQLVRSAGYRWCQARVVLTSTDPAYREKLDRVRAILGNLSRDEAFFSIDEYGPFAVKMKAGRTLTAPGEQRMVQQFQKSKGWMIMTAALELSGNQVTHFYSRKKNTAEMIRMMDLLVDRYSSKKRIYLSWDAASWHISKKLKEAIQANNDVAGDHGRPVVETAPLPAGAQFLNVIESVFSGMSRAIIHNSDYPSLEEAKAAIDRYFNERNAHFLAQPRRAGKKIWGKERVPPGFSEANNCKDPRYR